MAGEISEGHVSREEHDKVVSERDQLKEDNQASLRTINKLAAITQRDPDDVEHIEYLEQRLIELIRIFNDEAVGKMKERLAPLLEDTPIRKTEKKTDRKAG